MDWGLSGQNSVLDWRIYLAEEARGLFPHCDVQTPAQNTHGNSGHFIGPD